jgi:hypothetical protein
MLVALLDASVSVAAFSIIISVWGRMVIVPTVEFASVLCVSNANVAVSLLMTRTRRLPPNVLGVVPHTASDANSLMTIVYSFKSEIE